MTTRDHLIPEARTDKNGHVVTRLVKPQQNTGASGKSLPAPLLSMTKDDSGGAGDTRPKLIDVLSKTGWGDVSDGDMEAIVYSLSDDTVTAIFDDYGGDEDRAEALGKWVVYYESNENYLRELVAYRNAFDPETDSDFLEEAVFDLKAYDELPEMDDYSKADPELKEFITGLLSLTETLYAAEFDEDPEQAPRRIEDEGLRTLVFENPDKIEQINDVIFERDTTDADTIREVIMNETQALNRGVL